MADANLPLCERICWSGVFYHVPGKTQPNYTDFYRHAFVQIRVAYRVSVPLLPN